METKFQTSFIPKQPVTESAPHRASPASLFFIVAFILFMGSLAAAGAVFIYGQVVQKNIEAGMKELNTNKNAFDPNTIKQISRLNDRLNATYFLLKNHKSVSTLFQVLSNTTLKSVRFTDFLYDGAGEKVSISMKGQAVNYETVALQSKSFTDKALLGTFRSPIFSDLNLDPQGNVTFSFSSNIDPNLVSYYELKRREYGAAEKPTNGSVKVQNGLSAPSTAEQKNKGFIQTSETNSGAAEASNKQSSKTQ